MEADALEASVGFSIGVAIKQSLGQGPGMRHVRLAQVDEKFAAGIESRAHPVFGRLMATRIIAKSRLG